MYNATSCFARVKKYFIGEKVKKNQFIGNLISLVFILLLFLGLSVNGQLSLPDCSPSKENKYPPGCSSSIQPCKGITCGVGGSKVCYANGTGSCCCQPTPASCGVSYPSCNGPCDKGFKCVENSISTKCICVTPTPTPCTKCDGSVIGSKKCQGNDVQKCNASGPNNSVCSWDFQQKCASGFICLDGNCVTPTPTPCTACNVVGGIGDPIGTVKCVSGNPPQIKICDAASCSFIFQSDCKNGEVCDSQMTGCTSECGNGIPTGTETCDDKNTKSGDGCSSTCYSEPCNQITNTAKCGLATDCAPYMCVQSGPNQCSCQAPCASLVGNAFCSTLGICSNGTCSFNGTSCACPTPNSTPIACDLTQFHWCPKPGGTSDCCPNANYCYSLGCFTNCLQASSKPCPGLTQGAPEICCAKADVCGGTTGCNGCSSTNCGACPSSGCPSGCIPSVGKGCVSSIGNQAAAAAANAGAPGEATDPAAVAAANAVAAATAAANAGAPGGATDPAAVAAANAAAAAANQVPLAMDPTAAELAAVNAAAAATAAANAQYQVRKAEGEEAAEAENKAQTTEEPNADQATDTEKKCGECKPPDCTGKCDDPEKTCVTKFSKKKKKDVCKCRKQDAVNNNEEDDSDEDESGDE